MLPSRSRLAGALLLASVTGALAMAAQDPWQWEPRGRWFRVPPRLPDAASFDGAFTFCRIMYRSVRREAGGQGWSTDYPSADVNLSVRLSELTKMSISRQAEGEPNHLVVRLTDDALFQCPFAMIEDAGSASISDEEASRLREYLLKGGFLWVDDFWGSPAWDQWVQEIRKALPSSEYPIRTLAGDHPLFKTLFHVSSVPQIPSIQFWRMSGGATSERGVDSPQPDVSGISDAHGRLMVLMTHNTDIADAWEREGEDEEFFSRFSVDGYAVGINVVIYSMTH
jgi:hypothetical protein